MNLKNIQLKQNLFHSSNFKPYSTKGSIKTRQNKSLLKRIKKNQILSPNSRNYTSGNQLYESKYNFDNFLQELKNNQNPQSNYRKTGKIFNITKVVVQAQRKSSYVNFIQLLKINQLKSISNIQQRNKLRKLDQKQRKQFRLQNLNTHIKTQPIIERSQSYHKQLKIYSYQDKKLLSPPRSSKNSIQIFIDHHNISKNEIPLPLSKRVGVFRYKKSELIKLPIKQLKIPFSVQDQ